MSEKYAAGITNQELALIYLGDYLEFTIMGDQDSDNDYHDYAVQKWTSAMTKLDLMYKALDTKPPNTLPFFNALKEMGVS